MNKVSFFVKQTLAFITGDKAEQLALSNAKKANSAYAMAISRLKSDLDEAQDRIDQAQDHLNSVRFPTTELQKAGYIESVNNAKNDLAEAKEELETIKASIKEYEAEVKLITEEVDAPVVQ